MQPEVITTTVSVASRAINVLLDNGETERYALAEAGDGDLFWRHDTFGPAEDDASDKVWLRHGGRQTVGQVMERVPQCRREIRRWTLEEIEAGEATTDGDLFTRAIRREALARLAAELGAADAAVA